MKEVNKFVEYLHTVGYSIRTNWFYTLLFNIFLIMSIWITFYKKEWFAHVIDPLAGIMTFIVAIGIAIVNYNKLWRDQLPKKLNVHFMLNNKYAMSCFYADLVSESDIRNWALQLGGQISGVKLALEPLLDIEGPKVVRIESNGKLSHLYTITMQLTPQKSSVFVDPDKGVIYKRWYITQGLKNNEDRKEELDIDFDSTRIQEPQYNEIKLRRKNKEDKNHSD